AAAGTLLEQGLEHGAGSEKGAVQVDAQELLPTGKLELVERSNDLDAGITHQYVDLSKLLDGPRDARLHLLLVGDVHDDAERRAGIAELGGGRLRGLLVEIGDDDARAFAREDPGDVLADAAGGAGHDGNFVLQAHVIEPLQWREPASAQLRAWTRTVADNRGRPCPCRA